MTFTEDGSQEVKTDPNKEYAFSAQGTFDNGIVYLEWSHDGTTWSGEFGTNDNPVKVELSQDGGARVVAPARKMRVRLDGADSPSITAFIE